MSKAGKAGLVPKLRFPEFRGAPDWKTTPLGEASVPVEERVGERKLTPVSISAGIGFVRQSEKFGRDISGNQYRLYTIVTDGDFVYNKGNSLKFPQGCVYQLQGWGEVAAPNVFICFRLKEGYSDRFFQYCFEQNIHGVQLRKSITSGARSNGLLNISKDTFYSVQMPTPEYSEQQKIAECLAPLDALIGLEKERLEALKAFKKGLMQQLFPHEGERVPRLRFPEFRGSGEWEVAFGNELFDQASNRQAPAGLPILAISQDLGAVPREMIDYHVSVTEASIATYKEVKEGDFIISLRSFQGGIEYSRYHGICSPAYVVLQKKTDLSDGFFKHFFKSRRFIQKMVRNIEGLRDGKMISYSQFSELSLPNPAIAEQRTIANHLSALETLIESQEDKVESLNTRKQGLMQQLFPAADELEV